MEEISLVYTKSLKSILRSLQVDPSEGLSPIEAQKRLNQFGKNLLPTPEKISLWTIFFKQFANFMIYILLGATLLSLTLADYKDAALIGLVVMINTLIGFFQELKAEKTLSSLKKMASPSAKVIRSGQIEEIATELLVPGDIVVLDEGDVVPADIRLLESVGLGINESILTGEGLPAKKDAEVEIREKVALGEQINMVFMGTMIVVGNGRGVVVSTGALTQMGKIAAFLTIPLEKPTPLQRNLDALGKYLIFAAIGVSALIFLLGFAQGREWKELLFTVISLAVAVIPEGLVAVVTITMAIGVQKMARRNAIVRNLPAVETLGAVSVICSDKTGTLTEGKMVATDLWVGGRLYSVSGTGIRPEGNIYCDEKAVKKLPSDLTLTLTAMALCNNAILQQDESGAWDGVGDPTEIALQVLSHKLQYKKEELEKEWTLIEGLPFDSNRKLMSMIYASSRNKAYVLTKGAVEEVLSACKFFRVFEEDKLLTKEEKKRFLQINTDMAKRGLRVLALAMRPFSQTEEDIEPSTIERNLVFLGMVGVLDPVRPEAKNAVEECKRAGITVMMVTGDHPATAANIASQLGIFNPEKDKILTGEQLDKLDEEALCLLQPFPKLFARVSPENKLMLVNTLRKRMKFIVAMTGDGVNDAPAIKHANIGIAMGKEGTDVVKQAADIILADDNFATIVIAVEEGRRIFTNIQKFIRYLLSCNMSSVVAILFATAAGIPLPFTPIQILWLNLVTDTPPALALGFDPVEKDAMENPPRNPKGGIFRKADFIFILFHGILMASLMLLVFMRGLYADSGSLEKARTMAFSLLVLVQLAQAFNARSTATSIFNNIFANKSLLAALGLSFSLLLLGMYLPVLNEVFGHVELGPGDWLELSVGVVIFILFTELFKLIRRNKRKI